ncbi:MAG: RluA family pseudouridine synthase, partial [Oscillospiraceae bacterium]|nr:RluA family pseudouridine synthase [Oscillospiraceae bacterium]
MKEYIIGKNDASQRLDRFVSKTVPLLPPSLLQKYIRLKRIKVNNKGSKRDTKLVLGDTVQMYINDEFFDAPSEENAYLRIVEPKLDIIYEDENIMLVFKPAGMLCHSDGSYSYNTLIAEIQALLYARREWRPREENAFTPALCNRIDRNTSGIVIAAKNAEALRIMNEKIKEREISKFYLTIVHGRPRPAEGELRGYIFKDAKKNQVYVRKTSEPGAKTAVTRYRTLRTSGELSLVECELLTGRTHQIRAQMSDAGYPLLGDGKYGSERMNKKYDEKGQVLCSYRLVFSFSG